MEQTENKAFYQKLKKLVVPIAIENFMLALVSATDAVMLRMIDQDSMAAVSQAGQVQFILNMLVLGFASGIGIMAAQYWGKKDTKTIEVIAPLGLKILLGIGGLFMAAALLVPGFLMRILTNDSVLLALGARYIRMVAPSYLIGGITQVYFALLKNSGSAGKSSAISSFAVVLNIVLNALLIPLLGIEGAALATVLTRAVELVCAVAVNVRSGNIQLRWSLIPRSTPSLLRRDYLHYTAPFIGAGLVWGIAFMLYSIILGHLGGDAVAANSITSITKTLISCASRGVGTGAGIIIGNLLGANLLAQAKRDAARLTKLSAAAGIVTGLVLIAISPLLVRFAALTDTASGYLQIMLIFCGCNIMAQAVNHAVLDGIFGAGGDAKFDMVTNIFAMWCFSVPLGLLGAFVWKWPVPLVYCFVNLDEIVKLPAVFIHYKKYIWLRNITREV